MKTVLIAAFDGTGNEAEALRQSLEVFGWFVAVRYVARPRDLIEILSGQTAFSPEHIILSCHGEPGRILMPPLGESVYGSEEPRGDFQAKTVSDYLTLSQKTILNLGCCSGQEAMAKVFSEKNTYIAPVDYVSGSAALCFAVRFYYELTQNGRTAEQACALAASVDPDTALFRFFPPNPPR